MALRKKTRSKAPSTSLPVAVQQGGPSASRSDPLAAPSSLPTATTIDSLPSEVLSLIFEWADPRSLPACSVVCRRWSDSAQRTLYAAPFDQRRGFHGWIKSEARTRYPVRMADLTCLRLEPQKNAGFRVEDAVTRVLAECGGVRELNYRAGGCHWGPLQRPELRDVKVLELSSLYYRNPPSINSLPFQLTSLAFPLHHFIDFNPTPLLHALFSASASSLTSLRLTGGGIYTTTNIYEVLYPHFPLVSPSLRHLAIRLDTNIVGLLPLLADCPTLYSLDLDLAPFHAGAVPANQRSKFRRLTEDVGARIASIANAVLPGRIKRVEFTGVDGRVHWPRVLDFVRHGNLGGLDRVTFPAKRVGTVGGTVVMDECEARGIEVALREPPVLLL